MVGKLENPFFYGSLCILQPKAITIPVEEVIFLLAALLLEGSLILDCATPEEVPDDDGTWFPLLILIGWGGPNLDLLAKSEVDKLLVLVEEDGTFKRDDGIADCKMAGGWVFAFPDSDSV